MGKKKHEEHENHEKWIIPYADMVTLLFAFFVVMYAQSLQDPKKMKSVSESVSEAFVGNKSGSDKSKKIDVMGLDGKPVASRRFLTKRSVTNQEIMEEIKESLERMGLEVIYQDKASPIQFRIDERGLVISISAGYLFEPNSADIPQELYPIIQIISEVLTSTDRLVAIEGHTDNLAVAGSRFYDNWDLSTLRATSMLRLLRDEFSIDAKRMTSSGYASYRPVADNNTEEGRSQNRRVDIIMLNASFAEDRLEEGFVPGLIKPENPESNPPESNPPESNPTESNPTEATPAEPPSPSQP